MARSTADWLGNVAAFVLTIIVNGLATSIPLGGQTPPEISAKYPSLFTPAGFTFSIWGLIYLSLTLFIIYQCLPTRRGSTVLSAIDNLFKASCIANASWILVWHYDFLLLSVVIMVILLACLVGIYRRLQTYAHGATRLDRLAIYLPFSLYTAWISVALIANISAVQNGYGWDNVGLDAVTWTLLKLALAGAIAAVMVVRKSDIAFGLVVAWAAYGIAVKQAETPDVAGAAIALALMAIILVALAMIRRTVFLER